MVTITRKQARLIALEHQLLKGRGAAKSRRNLLKIIESLGYVQIDTISIVERAHHHVLWTRMPAYNRTMLNELQEKDRWIFEYWSHAAAYLPIKDYRYSHYRRDRYINKYKTWELKNKKIVNFVLDRIKAEGPLQSRDFESVSPKKGAGWWDWKPAKDALEHLFHSGRLMVLSRKGFQKIYDLTERVLPPDTDTRTPTPDEYHRHLIELAIKSHGLVSEKEITYLRNYEPKVLKNIINEQLAAGDLIKVKIKGADAGEYLSTGKIVEKTLKSGTPRVHILSPFDNLIIQRKRTKSIFGFDFNIEFYLPAHKRKFGYYCMPVLIGDKFIGKFDAKADRKDNMFEIINFFCEDGVKLNTNDHEIVRSKISDLAKFTGCEEVNWNGKI